MDLQKTGGTGGGRGRDGRFCKGRSGNPKGRPRGSENSATRAAVLLLDGEAEALTRKAVELAMAGDPSALRLCLERIVGVRRGRPVEVTLPPIASVADLAAAMAAIAAAAAEGLITPDEAVALSQMVEGFTRTLDAAHVERRRRWRGVLWKQSAAEARRRSRRKAPAG
ncbi:MAG TPA: DUF5681 domain-containing protein [Stellaceae bacterium]|jgi:hypothetical protein